MLMQKTKDKLKGQSKPTFYFSLWKSKLARKCMAISLSPGPDH